MSYSAGSIVVLKSGGPAMTVVAANGDDIECVWIGEEGDLFRQAIPAIALEAVEVEEDDEDEDEEDED